ncbi:MAG: SRPBCC family protein [Pseudomonadota bacterium]
MTDQIKRSIIIKMPVERLWRALTNSIEFGTWFGVTLQGEFVVGQVTRGTLTVRGHEGLPFWVRIEAMEAPKLFRFSWPYDEAVTPEDSGLDRKTTTVEFLIEPRGEDSHLTICESGFDNLPLEKRLQAFRDNTDGWKFQSNNIKTYLE